MPWTKLEAKIDKLDERLDKMDVHFSAYNEQLKEHIRRTVLLEEKSEKHQTHIDRFYGAAKLIVSGGALIALIRLLFKP